MLRERNIPSPGQYRFAKGLVKDKRLAQALWKIGTVKQLLSNEVYLGHMVQGRKREALWKGQKQSWVPKDQWIVVKNTHEAIVEEELFYAVQEINRKASEQYWENKKRFDHTQNTENILKGLVYCGSCGTKLIRYKSVRENKHKEPKIHIWYNYICPLHATSTDLCPFISILERDLLSVVYDVMKVQFLAALDMDNLMKKAQFRSTASAEIRKLEQQISQAKLRLENIRWHEETLYDDYSEQLMSERDYLYAQNRYQEQAKAIRQQIGVLEGQKRVHSQEKTGENLWLKAFLEFQSEPLLTRPMALELIDSVIVHNKTRITVNLRFQEEYQRLLELVTSQYEVTTNE